MRFIILLISLLIIGQTDAKDINGLTSYLKNSVSVSDQKKVNKLKKKASKKSKASDKAKYYLKAAQLGDYESQVAMGYYYGFGVCYPRAIEVDEENMTIKNKSSYQAINRNAAKYFFDNARKNNDVSYHMEQASLGLVLLSLDSLTNKKIAEEMYLTLLLCAVGLEEQMENDRQIYNPKSVIRDGVSTIPNDRH